MKFKIEETTWDNDEPRFIVYVEQESGFYALIRSGHSMEEAELICRSYTPPAEAKITYLEV